MRASSLTNDVYRVLLECFFYSFVVCVQNVASIRSYKFHWRAFCISFQRILCVVKKLVLLHWNIDEIICFYYYLWVSHMYPKAGMFYIICNFLDALKLNRLLQATHFMRTIWNNQVALWMLSKFTWMSNRSFTHHSIFCTKLREKSSKNAKQIRFFGIWCDVKGADE